jgi:subtilisin family serine protease
MTMTHLWHRVALAGLMALAAAWLAPAAAAEEPTPDHQILVMVRLAPEHLRPGASYGGAYGDTQAHSGRERVARSLAHKYGLSIVNDWPMPMIGVDCFVMAVPDGRSTSAAAEQVSHDSEVAWAEPMSVYSAKASPASAPNDPLFAAQPAAVEWHLADLHRIASGRGTKVAVIDSGIDAAHPDLSGQLLVNRNFVSGQQLVPEQHGTAVAGIIAAKADNHIGIAGIAPGSRLLGLRACWEGRGLTDTRCDTLSLAKALYFAVENRADVINLSLSGPDDRLLRALIAVALDKKLSVVSAFDAKLPGGGFPASVSGVIPVADSSMGVSRAGVFVAPGRQVPTTEPGGRWFVVNGSSFAAAHVSGLIALLHQRRPSVPPMLVALRRSGGRIDACATLIRAAGPCDCACGPERLAAAARR